MTFGGAMQYVTYLKHSFCSIALDIVSVDDDLDNSIPHFF
jgi:hypothetical protein